MVIISCVLSLFRMLEVFLGKKKPPMLTHQGLRHVLTFITNNLYEIKNFVNINTISRVYLKINMVFLIS